MQELAKQFKNIMNNKQTEGFTILSFLPRPSGSKITDPSFQPYSVKRFSDEKIFTIGDTVTNGTQMIGQITSFEMLDGEVFVRHTWSGVGMNLDSLTKIIKLPSRHQVGDKVKFSITQNFGDNPYPFTAEIKAVHFYVGKVKYDLEIPIEDESPTRIYNIDSCFVQPIK